jgi:hypothetical protein
MDDDHKKTVTVQLVGVASASTFGVARASVAYSYASEWLEDARRESGTLGYSARRREIVFATFAIESYLFEWVRDVVLHRDAETFKRYFPAGSKRGVTEKVRDLPKQLCNDGRISMPLDCSGAMYQNFKRLVLLRDELVHAAASRPFTPGLEDEPRATKQQLERIEPGWPCSVAVAIMRDLHLLSQSDPPDWLK